MASRSAEWVRVRMYNVGFGDCFLVTVGYSKSDAEGRSQHHMLVDLGSTRRSEAGHSLRDVARHIASVIESESSGKLDVLVVTHRHRDHLGGFGSTKTSEIVRSLNPQLVVRPWTDDPLAGKGGTNEDIGDSSANYATQLDGSRVLIERVKEFAAASSASESWSRRVEELADLQVPNKEAIATLDEIGLGAPNGVMYVKSRDELDLRAVMPDVHVEILGPPTVEQSPGITSQRDDDPDEFWLRSANAANAIADVSASGRRLFGEDVFSALSGPDGLGAARFLLDRMDSQSTQRIFQIAQGFDDAVNNTSIVFLMTVGSKTLLLTGDAQWESWDYTLNNLAAAPDSDVASKLANVDIYKVGHHGSRNATPKSL